MTTFRLTEEEFSRLESRFDVLRNEYQICKRKLDSKCQALLILSKELGQCRSERDQFKLMAEQLRERYQGLKKQVMGKSPAVGIDGMTGHEQQNDRSLNVLLYESREQNKSLQFEIDDLKQKLYDAQGDIKLLREQIARQRVGTADEGINTRHFPAHEREDLVKQLENFGEKYTQLERDLQQVLDEREEFVTERDAYKNKYERLNQELNYILKGDEKTIVDIDALIMENKYLQERLKQMEEEKSLAMATVSKYKNLLERKKTKSSLKLGQGRSGSLVISQKQVHQVLENRDDIPPSPQAMADIKALANALLETVNDKNLALSHQRKTNKILGNRVADLEKKIKTLEMTGFWNVSATFSNLEKLRAECDEVRTLIPQISQSSEEDSTSHPGGAPNGQTLEDVDCLTPSPHSSSETSPVHSSSLNSLNYSSDLTSPFNSSTLDSPTHAVDCCISPTRSWQTSPAHIRSTTKESTNSPAHTLHTDAAHKSSPASSHNSPIHCDKRYTSKECKGDISDRQQERAPLLSERLPSVETEELKSKQESPVHSPDKHSLLECETSVTNEIFEDKDDGIQQDETDLREMEKLCCETDEASITGDQINDLMESMTNKMIDCSHHMSKVKNSQSSSADQGIVIQSRTCEENENTSQEELCNQPLLGENSNASQSNCIDEQRDVEC